MTPDADELDPIYDGPEARWPEIPAWQVYVAVAITTLAALGLYALTKVGMFGG